MIYETEMGWVSEPRGPNSVYWRRIMVGKLTTTQIPIRSLVAEKDMSPTLSRKLTQMLQSL